MTLDEIILGNLPSAANVRYGIDRGDGTTGTCHVPLAENVLRGVAVDVDAVGTLDASGFLRLVPR